MYIMGTNSKMELSPQVLEEEVSIYIAGAQTRARALKGFIDYLFPNTSVKGFLVDSYDGNEQYIDSIPVILRTFHEKMDTSAIVFIATKSIYFDGISKELVKMGFYHIIPITFEIDNWFRNAYVTKKYKETNRAFIRLCELKVKCHAGQLEESRKTRCIYMATSIYDKPTETVYNLPEYERPIQVGAGLTENRIRENILADNVGDNISKWNRQFCELTGIYWIWKHAEEDIVGLSHYRRHFILPDDWQQRMEDNDIDVILPLHAFVEPSIEMNYIMRHDPEDWEFLIEYIRTNLSSQYDAARRFFQGNIYYPCNMFIMKKEVLNGLCEWLFPILTEVAIHGGEKADTYDNRYPGFISERLVSLYFEIHKDEIKIAHVEKNFIK